MKKILITLFALMLVMCVSVCSISALNIAVSDEEGVSLDSILSDTVYGYLGDADENGKVNVRDATQIQKNLAKLITLSDNGNVLADVNFSGNVNIKDATIVQKWVAMFDVGYPVYYALYATDDEVPVADMVGKWKAVVDFSDIFNSMFATEPTMAEHFVFTDIENVSYLTINDDGTYYMYSTPEDMSKTVEAFKVQYGKGMESYLQAIIDDNKLNTTVDKMLKESGFDSMEDFVDSAVSEDFSEELVNSAATQGYYEIEDNKLYTTQSLDEKIDKSIYETFVTDGYTLTLTGSSTDENVVYPVNYVRIK